MRPEPREQRALCPPAPSGSAAPRLQLRNLARRVGTWIGSGPESKRDRDLNWIGAWIGSGSGLERDRDLDRIGTWMGSGSLRSQLRPCSATCRPCRAAPTSAGGTGESFRFFERNWINLKPAEFPEKIQLLCFYTDLPRIRWFLRLPQKVGTCLNASV